MDLCPSSLRSSFSYAFTYDVFLSFRGSDTRYGFTGNLYKALCDKGIHTFIDDEKLQRGDKITPSLMEAIEKSRIAILVFSINYASSSFCLDELVNIMKRKDMLVLPIFYNVDPSDVRYQKGSYGKALANHANKFKAKKEKLEKWKMALHQAANLSGYHFIHGKGYEYEFIGKIVNLVSNKINRTLLHVADYPIGLESQIQEVKKLLDDIDRQEQLEAIVGEPSWFGPGSKVIITTRDKHLLTCHKVEKTFEVEALDKEDALQLLKWKAFKLEQVDPSYLDVLNRAVTYASGLPLALEVMGSNLYGRSIEEWESALNQYSRIPNNKIQDILKISYDALEEEERSVFLDIACCFKGYGLEEVNEMLCAHHGDNMKHHIRVLVDKSLIKIVDSDVTLFDLIEEICNGIVQQNRLGKRRKLWLHDLIGEMGKEIVRQESPKELEKRSRLWFHEDVV